MADERGGKYFREARIVLGGDKVAAQGHIGDARALLGYLRDMHSLGGPPIQTKYATLRDGTLISAAMMNGQYQATIVSPPPSGKRKKQITPTFFGETYRYTQNFVYFDAFKWQEETGILKLTAPPGSTSTHPVSVSEDGAFVLGVNYTYDATYVQLPTGFIVWGPQGEIRSLTPAPFHWDFSPRTKVLDYTYLDPSLIPVPFVTFSNDLYRHRFLDDGSHLFCGATATATTPPVAAAARRAAPTPNVPTPPDVLVLQDVSAPAPSYTYAASADGTKIVGEYGPLNSAAVWTWSSTMQAYTRADIPGAISALDITDDGASIACQVPRYRGNLTDQVPAIWTQRTGLIQLEQFDPNPLLTSYSVSTVAFVHSKGGIAAGQYALSPYSKVVFWKYDDAGLKTRYESVYGNVLGGN